MRLYNQYKEKICAEKEKSISIVEKEEMSEL